VGKVCAVGNIAHLFKAWQGTDILLNALKFGKRKSSDNYFEKGGNYIVLSANSDQLSACYRWPVRSNYRNVNRGVFDVSQSPRVLLPATVTLLSLVWIPLFVLSSGEPISRLGNSVRFAYTTPKQRKHEVLDCIGLWRHTSSTSETTDYYLCTLRDIASSPLKIYCYEACLLAFLYLLDQSVTEKSWVLWTADMLDCTFIDRPQNQILRGRENYIR
jgi:hypothetical protein